MSALISTNTSRHTHTTHIHTETNVNDMMSFYCALFSLVLPRGNNLSFHVSMFTFKHVNKSKHMNMNTYTHTMKY